MKILIGSDQPLKAINLSSVYSDRYYSYTERVEVIIFTWGSVVRSIEGKTSHLHVSTVLFSEMNRYILRITTQQKCLNGREPELIAIMAPWTWLNNNTDIQFHRTFSKYIPALRFPLKFTTSLIAELSVHNVFKLFAYWVILYFFCRLPIFPPKSTSLKILSGKPPECYTVWIQIRSELLSGLI